MKESRTFEQMKNFCGCANSVRRTAAVFRTAESAAAVTLFQRLPNWSRAAAGLRPSRCPRSVNGYSFLETAIASGGTGLRLLCRNHDGKSGRRNYCRVLPHPSPLPLGEGEPFVAVLEMGSRRWMKGHTLPAMSASFPLPVGEGSRVRENATKNFKLSKLDRRDACPTINFLT